MRFDCAEDIIQLTPNWKGERFANGRPKVPENILRRFESVTTEEAWGVLWELVERKRFRSAKDRVYTNAPQSLTRCTPSSTASNDRQSL